MKEMNNTTPVTESVAEEAGKKGMPRRRLFIVLISVLVALSLLTAAFAVFTFVDFSDDGKGSSSGGGSNDYFDYFTAKLSDYITLTEAQIKGLTIPGYDNRIDAVTDENVKKYINQMLLSVVALTDEDISQQNYAAAVKWSQAIDYADDVFLYIIRVEKEDGTRVDVDFFKNAYTEPGRMQIGMGYFCEAFDDALVGLVPMNTGSFERRTSGNVAADDVILISYTASETVKATEEGKADVVKNHKNYESLRLDLSEVKDTAWRDALLAAYGTVGQYFSFEYEEDVNEDGVKEKLKYEGVIDAVVYDEVTHPIVVTLPDDFFGENPEDAEYAALNGATLTFYINIDHMVPHDANTVETMTKADLDVINAMLAEGGSITFTPSNDKNGKGDLTTYTNQVTTKTAEIKKLEAEIANIKASGEIAKLQAEIAALVAEIADMEAAADPERAEELATKKNALETKKTTLKSKEDALAKKEAALATAKSDKTTAEAKLDEALVTMRTECEAFFKRELEESYAEDLKAMAGQLVYEYLVKNLTFDKLPEGEIESLENTAKEYVEYYYDQLSAADKRNYRDIDAYAAVYFGYDEKDYDGYVDYIENYLAPREIKMQLLLPGIYNTFINDESKLNAKIDKYVNDAIELTTSQGTPLTRAEILENVAYNNGEDYLRNYYAMPLVVYDYLAENNTVDWTLRDIENK